jgi:hypothetical protein
VKAQRLASPYPVPPRFEGRHGTGLRKSLPQRAEFPGALRRGQVWCPRCARARSLISRARLPTCEIAWWTKRASRPKVAAKCLLNRRLGGFAVQDSVQGARAAASRPGESHQTPRVGSRGAPRTRRPCAPFAMPAAPLSSLRGGGSRPCGGTGVEKVFHLVGALIDGLDSGSGWLRAATVPVGRYDVSLESRR